MCYKLNYFLNIIIYFINLKCLQTLNVNFQYNYNLHVEPFNTQIYKRELNQFYDKASFSLKGFEKIASIPLTFPIDICLINLEDSKYVSALHMKGNGARYFVVLKMVNDSYDLLANIPTPNAVAMDCLSFNNKGYVAIALNLTQPVNNAKEASPLYEISGNRLRAVQFFSTANLMSVYLRVSGNHFNLLQTYTNSKDTPSLNCPYFRWFGTSFDKIGQIPCSNARQLAPFSIDYESYVAVANYADQSGRTNTNSEIYKFSRDRKKFELFQKIKTNGAVDVKYFSVPYNEAKKRHFLVFGNSISTAATATREKSNGNGTNLEADSVFYMYDKGQFIPYQKLSLYAVQKFLPVQNFEAEKFILLVACKNQDIKIYNLNDWKFEESKVQFTEGALGKGVSNMRIFQEHENSYLIIANQLMADNETNIFLPIFKQEEHANILRQQMIDWANKEAQHLMTINIKDLREKVEHKLQRLEHISYMSNTQYMPQANIQTVITETLIYPSWRMSTNYWTALRYINQALDILENQLKEKQRLKRDTELKDPHEHMEYVYKTMNVKSLNVNKSLKAKIVNKISTANPEIKNIKAKKVIITEKYYNDTKDRLMDKENDVMTVRNLQISGKLNEYHWQALHNHTLKCKGDVQFFEAPIQIERLKTDTIVVNDDRVNGQNLEALIPIDGGKYIINQDIQFSAPVYANEVYISERLNNLHVFKGQFDVLLKNASKTQFIGSLKNVTNMKVLETINLAGKLVNHQLEVISSKKIINEPLVLHGNLIINGNVAINHHLNISDLIDLKENVSLKHTLVNGLRMDKNLKDVILKFSKPLKANHSLISFVSGHDLQKLIRLSQNDIQIIEGEKTFKDSVKIKRGFSEVKTLNGVDIEKLEQNAFLKHTNQSIRVPIKVDKIKAKRIESLKILLNNKTLDGYLILHGNQSIQGSLVLDNLKVLNIRTEHLNTNHKIFYQHLNDIYQKKSHYSPQDGIFQENRKFHGSIYVQNLILNTTINNKAVNEIENQLLQLEGNIKYVGNFKFNYAMRITNMTFQGKLNGILAQEFGKCWLQKKSDKQEFTAAQTFATVHATKGIQLLSTLNGFTMEDLHMQTFWIDRDEYLEYVNFENPIEFAVLLTTQSLNEFLIPQDVLLKGNKDSPIRLNSLRIDKDLKVEGVLKNISSINHIHLNELQELLDNTKYDTLYIENAYFSQDLPSYITLNNHDVKQTLDIVWLVNENVVLPHHVEIAYAYFEELLEFEGPINYMNLNYLGTNYFSKTRPQEVSTEIVFSEGAECYKDLFFNSFHVFGQLLEPESYTRFDFNEFVLNTLKITGQHIISGNWSLQEAKVEGNMNNVLVNQLNLITDVVLKLLPIQSYDIKSRKIFRNAEVENLYATNISLVNGLPVSQWIHDTVYLYENYTIKGTTTIDSLNVYNSLITLGSLNNITFDEHNLFLKESHQYISGSMKIVTYLHQTKRFLTNNIENLYVSYINQQHVPTFIENLVPNYSFVKVKSHLIFTQPLKVEKHESDFLNQWIKRATVEKARLSRESHMTTTDMMQTLQGIGNILENFDKEHSLNIIYFDIIQNNDTKSTKIFTTTLKFNSPVENMIIVLDMEDIGQIYKLFHQDQKHKATDGFEWLPRDPIYLKVIQKRFDLFPQPMDADNLKAFITGDLQSIHKALDYSQNSNNYFDFLNETCIIYEKYLTAPTKGISIYCMNSGYNKIVLNLPKNNKQVSNFLNSNISTNN